MKNGSRRGSAVLDAPEEDFAPEAGWAGRGPAPAGTLHRGTARDLGDESAYAAFEEPYQPRRGAAVPRWRVMMKSLGGRLLAAGGVLLVLGLAALALMGARSYLLHDSRFLLTTSANVQITGSKHVRRDEVLGVFAGDLERNIFKMPMAERRADLERLPWVQHATVMRLLPDHVRVAITERTPVAFFRQGSHIGLVDASGVLLDMRADAAGDPNYSFPVLTGLAKADSPTLRAAKMEIFRRFMGELQAAGGSLTQTISEVDVSDPEDIKALIAGNGTDILVHFGDEKFLERYRMFEAHLPEWKSQYPRLASADMRYDRQIVLEMQPGTGVPVEGGSGAAVAAGPGTTGDEKAVHVNAEQAVVAHAAPKVVVHHAGSRPKAAAKPTGPNARMFAALAAAHRAALARAQGGKAKP